jgi:hypothetical protein
MQLNLSSGGCKRRFYLHAVVLLAFVGARPAGMQCRHLDGNKLNNRLENLRWGTAKENASDSCRHGTLRTGSRQSQAKLTESSVLDIRRRAKTGGVGVQRQLSTEYGVSDTIISHVVSRKTWRHVP